MRRVVAWVQGLGSALSDAWVRRGKVECRAVGFYFLLSLDFLASLDPR